jgi:hypothetical protein
MLPKEFNKLPLAERSKMVFEKGNLIAIFNDDTAQKGFYYTLDGLKIDLTYDKVRNRLLNVIAWETTTDRNLSLQKLGVE